MKNLLCLAYEVSISYLQLYATVADMTKGVNSITPLALGGTEESLGTGLASLIGKLVDVGLDGTTLGCPANALSPNSDFFPNQTAPGGPLNLPPTANDAWSGDNVYNKVYFKTAPTTPQCSHRS